MAETVLLVAGVACLVLVAASFAVCVGMWVALALRDRAQTRVAMAALAPDCDDLPRRPVPLWQIERYDDMTDADRLAEIGWLRELVGPLSDPPVSPGRSDV